MNPHKDLFLLDDSLSFLNFGSFGACPRPVFKEYQQWQRKLEASPVQFITKIGLEALAESREALGKYLGAPARDLVFVTNPSYAGNAIVKSLPIHAGEEVLTTNLEYGAMDRTWTYYAEKRGFVYRKAPISLPIVSKDDFLKQFWSAANEKTKVVFLSHITSATALILPVEEIIAEAKKRGMLTIIDGAHTPAMLPLNLRELGADLYFGACHKWMMAPKGASFLYASPSQQAWLDPLVISWGFRSATPSDSLFLDYHQMNGTRDYSTFLTVPAAIRFMEENDWWTVAADCQRMVREWAPRFTEALGVASHAPMTSDWLGQMFAIPFPTKNPVNLYRKLVDHYRIEIPVTEQNGNTFVRYSFQTFNDESQLEQLLDVLKNERR
jgi:isopenicillin-N epimerase